MHEKGLLEKSISCTPY